MSKKCNNHNDACEITPMQQIPLHDKNIDLKKTDNPCPIFKVPVVLAETKLQIVVEADIHLDPKATEIKRVTKNVFLTQVKLIPVDFEKATSDDCHHIPGFFKVKRAKLFVAGHIRKNIEYSTSECQGVLQDRIVTVPFSGFAELKHGDFLISPIIGVSDSGKSYFLNDNNGEVPRLDKNFFQNLVRYNEQPYGELIGANFFELDFSPETVKPEGKFGVLREKIVMDLFLKVLQVQQFQVHAHRVLPVLDEGTLG
ncbi:MAG TPA: Uracil permease [Rummeliibacillus sp.]|nr:Uracil permease [Rummeliibacillus sp.]